MDYDFYWYVFEFEYCQNPDKDRLPNENDKKYLEYCELLMQAKEHGLGYRVEWKDTLYLVPTPLVLIDEHNRFHSEIAPAICWKGGKEVYYLSGVYFEKALWQKIVDRTITVKEVLSLENAEQRALAMNAIKDKLASEGNAKVVSEDQYGKILELDIEDINNDKIRLFTDIDPSKNEPVYLLCPPDCDSPQKFLTQSYKLERFSLDYEPIIRT